MIGGVRRSKILRVEAVLKSVNELLHVMVSFLQSSITLSEVINEPLDPGANDALTGLKFSPRGAKETEENSIRRLDSLMGLSIVLDSLNIQ